ncbi:MAG: hypothetical protein ACFFC7_28865, partial [Candidatus Hermodarchaeota archaeon]
SFVLGGNWSSTLRTRCWTDEVPCRLHRAVVRSAWTHDGLDEQFGEVLLHCFYSRCRTCGHICVCRFPLRVPTVRASTTPGKEETQERMVHYVWELSLAITGTLAALFAVIFIIWTGGFGLSMTDLLLVLPSVLIVVFVGILATLSRQRARVSQGGIAPEWLILCRVKRSGMIPWRNIEKVEVQRIGRGWRFHLYLRDRKRVNARFELFVLDFQRPDAVVNIVRDHFPVDAPEEPE